MAAIKETGESVEGVEAEAFENFEAGSKLGSASYYHCFSEHCMLNKSLPVFSQHVACKYVGTMKNQMYQKWVRLKRCCLAKVKWKSLRGKQFGEFLESHNWNGAAEFRYDYLPRR